MATTNTSVGKRNTVLAFEPSWLSAVLCVFVSLAVIAGGIALDQYRNSPLHQQFLVWRTSAATSSYATTLNAEFTSDRVQSVTSVASTFAFWFFVGFLTYSIVYGIYEAVHTAREFGGQLGFVHLSRGRYIWDTVLKISTRLSALVLWFAYILLFVRGIVPLTLAAIHVAATNPISLSGLEFSLGAFTALAVSLHIHVVLIRLVLLRTRVFTFRD